MDTAQGADREGPELVLVRYGELALKGGNRPMFESALVRNMKAALQAIGPAQIERRRGRVMVLPERRVEDTARRLCEVFGISSVSPAWGAPPTPDDVASVAKRVLDDALAPLPTERELSFRVRCTRADKAFPLTSSELNLFVAERVMPAHAQRLRVQLKHPELELGVDVRRERAYVFARRLPGPGGLPVGTLGRGVCLLSGGIDSPVAAWMAMKRGLRIAYLSFISPPFLGEPSRRKLIQLVRRLAPWQPRNRLYFAPFTEIQTAIRDGAPEPYRTVLYRRFMQRIASRVARRERARCLITGESLGQVASQTLENMTCIGAASELPVLRPLVAYDKQETISVAKRIGTFETSILPEPDCCTVFMPAKPIIRGRLDECEQAEAQLDTEGLVERAVKGLERIDVSPGPA